MVYALFTFLALITHGVNAFAPSAVFRTATPLCAYIESDSVDEEMDPKANGMGLALDSAILVSGGVDKKGVAIAKEMKHYSKVTKSDSSNLVGKVICKGEGQEIYKDPGLSTEKIIALAPLTAVENALKTLESNEKSGNIYINFAGGDDLMVHEVLDGVGNMVSALELSSNIEFRSLCEPSFPMEKCGVAVLSFDGDSSEGQLFYNEGEWYTLLEDDVVSILD